MKTRFFVFNGFVQRRACFAGLVGAGILLCGCQTAQRQTEGMIPASRTAGQQRFLHPPSDNGLVYYLAAGDALVERFNYNTPIFRMPPQTIYENSADIYDWVRQGLGKPRYEFLPGADVGAANANLLSLAFALSCAQRATLQAGRPSEAVDYCLQGLKYGRDLQAFNLELAWCGVSADLIALQPLAQNIDSVPVESLEKLQTGLKAWLEAQPRPYVQMWRKEGAQALTALDPNASSEQERDPALEKQAIDQFNKAVDFNVTRHYYAQAPMADTMQNAFNTARKMAPSDLPSRYVNMQLLIALMEARARLLMLEAATRVHRARTGSYPASLSDLNLGDHLIDPFSGQPFIYRPTPDGAPLIYSVGRDLEDDGGQPMNVPLRFDPWQFGSRVAPNRDLFAADPPPQNQTLPRYRQ